MAAALTDDWLGELLEETPKTPGNSFGKALRTGNEYELKVAHRLMKEGFYCSMPQLIEGSATAEYTTHQKDVIVLAGGRPAVLEVKSRNLRFTGPEDYPFKTVFIDTVSGFDSKAVTPDVVVIISQQTEAIMIIPVKSTRQHWTEETKYIWARGHPETNYAIKPHLTKSLDWFIDKLKQLEEDHED